uniref:Transcription initiation factor TFIID subunit 12 n=1 Tax=Magallana gigas TaxID=29159 RepID=A0A8W8JA65_MAGGI
KAMNPAVGKLPDGSQMLGATAVQPIAIQQPMGVRQQIPATIPGTPSQAETKVLDKRRLQELVKEIDPMEQLDEDVEEALLNIADDFIDSIVTSACQIAKHRKSSTLEVKDVQLHLERNWNMWIPGFGMDDLKPYKKASATEAHKQRMALIRKTLKKY